MNTTRILWPPRLTSDPSPQEVIQEQFHQQIFSALIPTLEAPEPRYDSRLLSIRLSSSFFLSVHSHAAAALINFCEGVERETLIPYLDPIVERLLKLLNPGASAAGQQPKRYVQEQVITTLAMVADASEVTFAKVSVPACELACVVA